MIYHHYTKYEANDSQMMLYNFTSGVLRELSSKWSDIVINPMNGIISPDGKNFVFMGRNPTSNCFNIFEYDLTSDKLPINLSQNPDDYDEDVHYNFDGSKFVFKHNWHLVELDRKTGKLIDITDNTIEASQPVYYTDTQIVYSSGADTQASIWTVNTNSKVKSLLYDHKNLTDYYPARYNKTHFIFTSWYDEKRTDQLFIGRWDGKDESVRLSLNDKNTDHSDAAAFGDGSNRIALCTTEKGNYDLYFGDVVTGEKWSLDLFNTQINTELNELAPCVYIEKEESSDGVECLVRIITTIVVVLLI
ncbi:hypothetical protein EIN_419760 [Entamoeba invadens IP1]|uniref:Uncharacterized protein n=1 Tax=Entamoeba invadens IP1 TaxID=370355 RepID=A0A0A1U5C9_ENTIV|nr:hypothetical protein EIN_419760 [Entamoeba invadens IP1]ELP88027.1 hypothetical protein EIN_419760 [Entamoeba invadens IP1]|eukprot:XP_004254798.1 hypothetical protein EIN_419760 [Entamoeba invadens IP1]